MGLNLRPQTDRQLTLSVAAIGCMASLLLVILHLWVNRDLFDPEGISYLDMADAYLRGDWQAALNSTWSPMYSWLLALMMLIFNPPAQWEFTAVHALNIFVFLIALSSFSIFMREFLRANEERANNERLPDWSWLVLGYSLFTWSTIQHIPPHLPEPDLLLSALVYLIFAMLFRIRNGVVTWGESIFLGMLLGFGYLTKSIMLPMAIVFAGVAMMLARRSIKMQFRILVAFFVFLFFSLSYIVVLSNAKGHWTYSDAGKVNYAWDINKVKPHIHWQGEEPGHGVPVHPTRKIHNDPPMYEFGTPIKATYPPWYDPSYWYEGVKVTVDLQRQLQVFVSNTKEFIYFFINTTGPATINRAFGGNLAYSYERTIGPLLTLFCVIVLANLGHASIFRRITEYWFALIPIGAVLMLYALLHFEGRYIAFYVVVLWMVLFQSVAIPKSEESKRLFTAILTSAALIAVITLSSGTVRAVVHAARYLVKGNTETPFLQSGYTNWKVAEYLQNAGLRAGDPVGSVGYGLGAYWARMARVRVVAEIPEEVFGEGAKAFWVSSMPKRATVMKLFRDMGVKAVVANGVTVDSAPVNWRHIEDTSYYVCVFPIDDCK